MEIYIKDIIKLCDGKLLSGDENIVINNIKIDSRKINDGDIYVGIRGEVNDGNIFFEDAINRGAKAIIVDNSKLDYDKYSDVTIVIVKDTVWCLQELARYKRSLFKGEVIAITGSVGKTTTKDMVASILSEKYKVLKTEGNYNNHIGLPLTILNYTLEDVMVVELGMSHEGELSLLSRIAKPTLSIITNVGTAHIGNLGSRENILKAKLEILDGMDNKKLIINNDNDMLHEYYVKNSDNVITVGINSSSMYRAVNVRDNCLFFDIDGYLENVKNVYMNEAYIINLLVGYAVGSLLGLTNEEYLNGVKKVTLSSKRLEMVMNKYGYNIINDSYNANYDSMKVGLEYLHNINYSGRKIAVLADMLELGEYSKKIHEDVGMEVVKNKIDVLVTVGEYARYINDKAISVGFDKNNSYHFNNNIECIDFLKRFLKREDTILFKGSNGMKLYEIIDEITYSKVIF